MNSSEQRDAKTFHPQCPQIGTKCLNGFLTVQPLIALTGFIPKEQKGEGKEKIESTCFLNGEFQKYGQAFLQRQWLTSTLLRSPCSSPSPFSVSLSASEQKHTAHPAQHNTPAKSSLPAPQLLSFTPTLFPGHALTARLTLKLHRDVQTGRQRLPPSISA